MLDFEHRDRIEFWHSCKINILRKYICMIICNKIMPSFKDYVLTLAVYFTENAVCYLNNSADFSMAWTVPYNLGNHTLYGFLLYGLIWQVGRLTVGKPVVNMLGVGTWVGESFQAFWTHERFLAAVEPSVLGEMVFMFESLVTFSTLMWT